MMSLVVVAVGTTVHEGVVDERVVVEVALCMTRLVSYSWCSEEGLLMRWWEEAESSRAGLRDASFEWKGQNVCGLLNPCKRLHG